MRKLSLVVALVAFPFLPISTAGAVATPPCTAPVAGLPGAGMDIIPLANGIASYCVSDYGWSDTWFIGSSPAIYDPRFDVLSGDDAPNLHYGIDGSNRMATSGFGWISPIMDNGTLTPSFATGSPWTVTTPVHPIAPSTVQSLVHNADGIDLQITTSLAPAGQQITQTFTITNVRLAGSITDLLLADYFNFHPNGSTAADATKGTVSYDPLSGITITGLLDGTFISDGTMRGERVDDEHGYHTAGFFGLPIIVFDMVQTDTYNNAPAGVGGSGDVAGGLAWELGDLAPGESASFSIYKMAPPLTVPEPATLALLGAAFAGLGVWRRRSATRGSSRTAAAE